MLIILVISCVSIYVYAFQTVLPHDPPLDEGYTYICDTQLTESLYPIAITEVYFDGTDERIEITNTTPYDIYDTFTLLGAKSSEITLPNITIPAYTSILLADTAHMVTGNSIAITGLGLSISDTLGTTLSLTNTDGSLFHTLSIAPDTAQHTPARTALTALFVSGASFWEPVRGYADSTVSHNVASGYIANPGRVFCYDTLPPDTQDSLANEQEETELTSGATGETEGGIDSTDDTDLTENPDATEDTSTTENSDTTGTYTTGTNRTEEENQGEGGEEHYQEEGVSPQQTVSTQISGGAFSDISSLQPQTPCVLSEVHSVVDVLPEYIELYCEHAFSGTVIIEGLATATTKRYVSFVAQTGQYYVITSTVSGFIHTENVLIVSSTSLRDDGEDITLVRPDGTTHSASIPLLQKGQSYYPGCIQALCPPIALPSPGFTDIYMNLYKEYFPTNVVYQTAPASSPASSSSSTSTSTYYQDLYKKRKQIAEDNEKAKTTHEKTIKTHEKTIASLEKSLAAATKQKEAKATTKTATVPTTKATQATAKAATSTTKTSTAKTPTPTAATKTKTVSTTSKAYILLTNEHKLYKTYIDFLHTYLKSHLYTQYDTLHIPAIQSLLKKSLQTAKKNSTMIAYTGETSISIFDFSAQRDRIYASKQQSLDLLAQTVYSSYTILTRAFHPLSLLLSGKQKQLRSDI